jgi:hypothetical protein
VRAGILWSPTVDRGVELGGGDGGALPCGELRWFISGWRGEREGLLVSHGATWRVGASLGGAVGGGSALMAGACW